MKRLLVILIVLGLILTGCASIKETAKGEESPEEVITQQEQNEESTENTEPAATTEPADDPSSSPDESASHDGWDMSVEGKAWGDKTPLQNGEMPASLNGKIIDWMRTDFGIVVITTDNYICFVQNGKITVKYDVETGPNDFLFDASTFNENATSRWYGYVNNSILRFIEQGVELEAFEIADMDFTGVNWYCYMINSGYLWFWSPSSRFVIDDNVREIYTKNGYTFYGDYDDDAYVIDANAYTMGRQTQEYIDMHPVTPVRLGKGPIYDYYVMLNPRAGESNSLAASRAFEEQYGLDTLIWGNPTDKIDIEEFVDYATESRYHIYDHYGFPTEDSDEMFMFDNITFRGYNGHLRVFYEDDKISCLSWTSYEHSRAIYEDLLNYLLRNGPTGEVRTPREGQIEESAIIDGFLIFAGYEDSSNGQYTYAFIEYQ